MMLSCDSGCHIISEENKNNNTFFDWIRYMLLKIGKISFGAKSSLLGQIYRKPSAKLALHFEGQIWSMHFSETVSPFNVEIWNESSLEVALPLVYRICSKTSLGDASTLVDRVCRKSSSETASLYVGRICSKSSSEAASLYVGRICSILRNKENMRIYELRECEIPYHKIVYLLEYRYIISKIRKSKSIALLSIFNVCYKFNSQISTQKQAVTNDYIKLNGKLICSLQINHIVLGRLDLIRKVFL